MSAWNQESALLLMLLFGVLSRGRLAQAPVPFVAIEDGEVEVGVDDVFKFFGFLESVVVDKKWGVIIFCKALWGDCGKIDFLWDWQTPVGFAGDVEAFFF